ncbi:MAG TPA: hypothetical protein VNT30_09335 [Stellaceae bacterium]|nr:hypothetical protein [Stellaceae bacterium]
MKSLAAEPKAPSILPASCGTCGMFLAPKQVPDVARGYAEMRGDCRRYPTPVKRHVDDWCGEHREQDLPHVD